jgi:hypothetical protein
MQFYFSQVRTTDIFREAKRRGGEKLDGLARAKKIKRKAAGLGAGICLGAPA